MKVLSCLVTMRTLAVRTVVPCGKARDKQPVPMTDECKNIFSFNPQNAVYYQHTVFCSTLQSQCILSMYDRIKAYGFVNIVLCTGKVHYNFLKSVKHYQWQRRTLPYIYIYVYPMLILKGDSFSTLLHKELPAILIKFLVAVPDLYKMKETDPGAFSQWLQHIDQV